MKTSIKICCRTFRKQMTHLLLMRHYLQCRYGERTNPTRPVYDKFYLMNVWQDFGILFGAEFVACYSLFMCAFGQKARQRSITLIAQRRQPDRNKKRECSLIPINAKTDNGAVSNIKAQMSTFHSFGKLSSA